MISKKMWVLLFSTGVHKESWFYVGWSIFFTAIALMFQVHLLVGLGLVAAGSILFFFRDPYRVIAPLAQGIVSPADGIIMEVLEDQKPPKELHLSDRSWKKVGIFLAPWHPHMNRIPSEGRVERVVYREGSFSHVATEQTQNLNERLSLVLALPSGDKMVCVQIAGFLARRILCYAKEGQEMEMGKKYGLICFGSRLDLYLPPSSSLIVCEGQRVLAGESVLGFLSPPKSNNVEASLVAMDESK